MQLRGSLSILWHCLSLGLPESSDSKASACNVEDLGLIPGSGRSPGEGNGNPLQYSCLENSMDGGPIDKTNWLDKTNSTVVQLGMLSNQKSKEHNCLEH